MQTALKRSKAAPGELDNRLFKIRESLLKLNSEINGNSAKQQIGEKTKPTLGDRLFSLQIGIGNSTYGPTETHKKTMGIVNKQITNFKTELSKINQELSELSKALLAAGAPWVESEQIPEK